MDDSSHQTSNLSWYTILNKKVLTTNKINQQQNPNKIKEATTSIQLLSE